MSYQDERVSQSDCDVGIECVSVMWGQTDSAAEHKLANKMSVSMFVMGQMTGNLHRYI